MSNSLDREAAIIIEQAHAAATRLHSALNALAVLNEKRRAAGAAPARVLTPDIKSAVDRLLWQAGQAD